MGQNAPMKTTIDISDTLLTQAKRLAREQNLTLRSLTEEGLRRVISERTLPTEPRVKPVTFEGRGLSSEFRDASWSKIRAAAYASHGS